MAQELIREHSTEKVEVESIEDYDWLDRWMDEDGRERIKRRVYGTFIETIILAKD